jgi:hypothetical protein
MKTAESNRPVRANVMASFGFALLAASFLAATIGDNRTGVEGVSSAFAAPFRGSASVLQQGATAPPAEPVASADLLGFSGRLRAVMGTEDVLARNPLLKPLLAAYIAGGEASWPKLATLDGDSLTVVTLLPLADAGSAGYARYHVGQWPSNAVTSANGRYAAPAGFIGVTEENQGTRLSTDFTMRDFLTHDQGNVWPKILVLQPRLLDKLELLHAELEREGLPSRLHVMSGFRTPQYNAQGVGSGGRAEHSRHMYGDAADVFVDADQDGMMDDLNGDGRITVADAVVLRSAAERVEAEYPSLVGGLSAYPATSEHGPFVHVDARGFRARW